MLERLRRGRRLPVAALAAGIASVLAAGTVSAVQLGEDGRAAAPSAALRSAVDVVPQRADRDRTVAAEEAVSAAPVPAEVAALTALHAPDVVLRSSAPLPAPVVEAVRAVDGVTATALLDAGTTTVGGGEVSLVGVDPSEFRAFTPQETAASDDLWRAVARGELAVGYALAQQRGLPLGEDVAVGDGTMRLGAVAAFGLVGGDALLTRERARQLGAVPDSVLVVAAPDAKTAALKKAVAKAAGPGVEVEVLRQAEAAPSTIKGRPSSWRELYIDSTRYCPGLSWTILASIGQIESGHGKNLGPSSAGALGPMQFMPATWAAYGIDGDRDGTADIMNPLDAVPSAASYLCKHGATRGEQGLYNAIFAYNHADWYVRKVLALAAQYQ